jgi:protein-S-isoprenylcysteine O-methyltransferase Ste14
MAPPLTATSFLLSLMLAAPFLYFLVAGGRAFKIPELSDAGAALGSASFVSGAAAVFWIGLHEGVALFNGIAGGAAALLSVLLYEWTRRTIDGRGIGLAGQVPDALCESGPYGFLRHPFYLSYMLAFLGVVTAIPGSISVVGAAFRNYKSRVGVLLVLPGRR